jgi:tRNA(adenine34) deaminase
MQHALKAAQHALTIDEVPVGAVIVKNDELISSANNMPIKHHDPSAHAEIVALRSAAQKLQNYRLVDTTIYVTLEPCMMCAGAMLHARVKRLVFGASDPKTGVAGGRFNWLADAKHTHKIEIVGGILQQDCSALLKSFFQQKRAQSNC